MTFAVRNHWGGASAVSLNLTISSNTTAYNVFTAAGSPVSPANVTVTVNSGVFVAGNFFNAALNTGTGWASGSTITLINNGTIVGNAGSGGNPTAANQTAGNNGTAGNTAITAQIPLFITNNNIIAGGGGGGGSGATIYSPNAGGTINNFGGNGSGGIGSTGTGSAGGNGSGDGPSPTTGSNTPGGAGGVTTHGQRFGSDGLPEAYWNTSTLTQTEGGAGGGGGGWGGWGSDGQQARYNTATYAGGNGGAGGAVITGSANVTWIVPGLRYGRIDATPYQYFGGTVSGTSTFVGTAATVRLTFGSNGTITEADLNTSRSYVPSLPSWWHGPQTTSIGSSYWIRATLTGGTTPTAGTMGSWTSMSTDQTWRVDSLTTTSSKNSVIFFEISTSATGTPVVTSGTFNITAIHT